MLEFLIGGRTRHKQTVTVSWILFNSFYFSSNSLTNGNPSDNSGSGNGSVHDGDRVGELGLDLTEK